MNLAVAIQIFGFLSANKDTIKQIILSVEDLVGQVAGPDKAAVVKFYIATAMGIEAEIEQAWPVVAPLFNAFVALVKANAAKK